VHLDASEREPDALARVQLWGTRRQTLQVETLRRAVREELLKGMASVNGCALPDEHHPARQLPQQALGNGRNVAGIKRMVLAMAKQLPVRAERYDGGEMVAGPPLPRGLGLPRRRPRAHPTGQGIEARFVYEEGHLLLRVRPYWSAGHASARQRATAASSRWRVRRMGF
jgi:hypothetical protein